MQRGSRSAVVSQLPELKALGHTHALHFFFSHHLFLSRDTEHSKPGIRRVRARLGFGESVVVTQLALRGLLRREAYSAGFLSWFLASFLFGNHSAIYNSSVQNFCKYILFNTPCICPNIQCDVFCVKFWDLNTAIRTRLALHNCCIFI